MTTPEEYRERMKLLEKVGSALPNLLDAGTPHQQELAQRWFKATSELERQTDEDRNAALGLVGLAQVVARIDADPSKVRREVLRRVQELHMTRADAIESVTYDINSHDGPRGAWT